MERPRSPENRQPAAGALTRSVSRRAIRSLMSDNPRGPAARAHYVRAVTEMGQANPELTRAVLFCSAFHRGRGLYSEADSAAHQRGLLLYVRAQELAVRGEGRQLVTLSEADTTNILEFYIRSLSPDLRRSIQVIMPDEFSEAELAEFQEQTAQTPPGTYLPGEGADQWWQRFFRESVKNSPFYEQHVELMEQMADEHRNVAAAVTALFAAEEPFFATEMLEVERRLDPHSRTAGQLMLGAADAWQMFRLRSDPEFGGA